MGKDESCFEETEYMLKRKHHYVWRHYLKPWTSNDQIFCYRKGSIFNTNLMNVANVRDFYELNELTEMEIELLKKFVELGSPPMLKKLQTNWISIFTSVFEIRKKIRERGESTVEQEENIKEIITNAEENLHKEIEAQAINYLNLIYKHDVSFFQTEKGFIDFVHFLAVQYLRTKKIASKYNSDPLLSRIWGVLKHVLATNMCWAMQNNVEEFHIFLLKNNSHLGLITSDQPVYNTLHKTNIANGIPEKLELYYPVSPSLAVLLTQDSSKFPNQMVEISVDNVEEFNKHVLETFDEQLFSHSEEMLRYTLEKNKSI